MIRAPAIRPGPCPSRQTGGERVPINKTKCCQRGLLVYPNPPTGTPAFSVSGKYVYEHPASSKPRYYLG